MFFFQNSLRLSILILFFVFSFTCFAQETDIIDKFRLNPEETFSYFANPVLKNETEIRNWIKESKILMKELTDGQYDKNDLALKTQEMLEVYDFIFDASGIWEISGNLFYIKWAPELGAKVTLELEKTLKNSYYEVLKKIRKAIRVKPPEGLIFVWIFSSRDKFTESLNLSQEIGGITYMCKFILLPLEYYNLYDFPISDFNNFEKTFSHEVAHSFFNSIIGAQRAARLPKWFKEGVAIHFGGDRKFSFRGQTRRELSREYKGYYDLFKYIKSDFGEIGINRLINRTINGFDPDLVFAEIFGYNSPEEYLSYKKRILYLKFSLTAFLLLAALFIIYKILQKFNIEISLSLYMFWIGLIILCFIVYSSVIIVSLKSRILLLINGILLFFIVINDITFNIKFRKLYHRLLNFENYRQLENALLEILEFFKYKSRRKKKKIASLIETGLEKLLDYFQEKNLFENAEMFYNNLEKTINDNYDLRTSDEIEKLMEQYEQKIEFLKNGSIQN